MPTAILDHRAPKEIIHSLSRRGIQPLLLPPHPHLPPAVASHPDMLIFFAREAVYTTASYLKEAKTELTRISAITGLPLRTTARELRPTYPADILLNAAPVGNKLFCHPPHTARELTSSPDFQIIPVRQGYAKCSVVPVGSNAIITSDPSISRVAQELKMDLLRIRPGSVALPGYDSGFIGGASSFAPYGNMREIFFCGSPAHHPDGEQISRFIRAHGMEPVSLSDSPLTDVGTVLILNF